MPSCLKCGRELQVNEEGLAPVLCDRCAGAATSRARQRMSATGTLRYHDLTINYFNGLPLVRQVAGTAGFTGKHLDITPTSGVLKGLKITGGLLQLSELGERNEWLNIDLVLAGPLQDELEVVDSISDKTVRLALKKTS